MSMTLLTRKQQINAIRRYRAQARKAATVVMADPTPRHREDLERAVDRLFIVTRGHAIPRDSVKQAVLAVLLHDQPPRLARE
jgi:hypothetical protein